MGSTNSIVASGASLTSLTDLSSRRFSPHAAHKATMARKSPRNHHNESSAKKTSPARNIFFEGLMVERTPDYRPPLPAWMMVT